jgi:hypothetical protein
MYTSAECRAQADEKLAQSQDRRFRHPDGFSGLPQGVTHLLRSVPRTDPRNGAAERLTAG